MYKLLILSLLAIKIRCQADKVGPEFPDVKPEEPELLISPNDSTNSTKNTTGMVKDRDTSDDLLDEMFDKSDASDICMIEDFDLYEDENCATAKE
jgi:hypothetical protein